MKKINNFVFKVKNLELPKDLIRYTYKDDGSIYVDSYEEKGEEYILKIRDIDANGTEIFKEFRVSKSMIRRIEEIS